MKVKPDNLESFMTARVGGPSLTEQKATVAASKIHRLLLKEKRLFRGIN